jgi:hypothetical protein
MRLPPVLPIEHQPGLPQNGKMLRNRRLRDTGPHRQRPHRLLPFAAQLLEDRPPRRVSQRLEQQVATGQDT